MTAPSTSTRSASRKRTYARTSRRRRAAQPPAGRSERPASSSSGTTARTPPIRGSLDRSGRTASWAVPGCVTGRSTLSASSSIPCTPNRAAARDRGMGILGVTVALVAAPLVSHQIPELLPLAFREVAVLTGAYLLWIATGRDQATELRGEPAA